MRALRYEPASVATVAWVRTPANVQQMPLE